MTFETRTELKKALCKYTTDTLSYVATVRSFCKRSSRWMLYRETELNMMKTGIRKNLESGRQKVELEKELSALLEDTLPGLEELQAFLDAVEKLAVTSIHVFTEGNQTLKLPTGTNLKDIHVVLIAAHKICPLLLQFKRNAGVFFLPVLHNVDVMIYQLDRYIKISQIICDTMQKSCFSESALETETTVDLRKDLSDYQAQGMLLHINQLNEIREDQNFRMVFLFGEESKPGFTERFSEQSPRMLQFLDDLEVTAVQLDRMNKGAKISSVAGSSVGLVGGVLSIVGLALIPVTAGVSFALTMTGLGLGVTSGVNGIVTTATEIGVNQTEKNKANKTLKSFMKNVQALQEHLEEVSNRETDWENVAWRVGSIFGRGVGVLTAIDRLFGAYKILNTERAVAKAAAEIPDISQAAAKGALSAAKSARAGAIALNALFIGMDVFFICKDSISLAKGEGSEESEFIRAKAKLWRSEMDSWQKIHDSLCRGRQRSVQQNNVLKSPFYPWISGKADRGHFLYHLIILFLAFFFFYLFVLSKSTPAALEGRHLLN
ncbi:uncharacterized protein LOC142890005 isoform X2 [Nelusetta ayraudi]|uniref:uncharacterized protein LOC142890005 isoform X2 n=1 Tax=Nelusetta ayraudi TaxID=303726 RepID=UPI003F6FAACD